MKTIAQQALDILKPIPAKNWMRGSYTNGKDKCCGMGHINRVVNNLNYSDFGGLFSYSELREKLNNECREFGVYISNVNDAYKDGHYIEVEKIKKYLGFKTPKQRVIALLKDMVEEGY